MTNPKTQKRIKSAVVKSNKETRRTFGRSRSGVSLPVPPPLADMPENYGRLLGTASGTWDGLGDVVKLFKKRRFRESFWGRVCYIVIYKVHGIRGLTISASGNDNSVSGILGPP